MKIIKIKSRNINALRRETEIDFSQPHFQDKIFAIVGKTGAGKSTLLDIITMALYAQTSRLGQQTLHTISHGCSENMCEVTFEVHETLYLSRFEQNREVQDQRVMTLFQGETPIAHGTTEVPHKIQELLGLDFNAFTKAMLLPQGLFNQFLTAPSDQRISLLEQLQDTRIYAEISKEVYQQTQTARQKLQEMEESVKELRQLTPEKRQTLEERMAILSQEKKGYDIETLMRTITEKRAFDKNLLLVERQKEELEELQKKLISKQFEEKEYHDFLQFSVQEQKKIEQAKLLDHELEFNQKNLKNIEQEIASVEQELNQVNATIQAREEQLSEFHIKETLLKKELENFPNMMHLQQNFTLIQSKFNERLSYLNQLQNLTQVEEHLSEKPLSTEISQLEKRHSALTQEIKKKNVEKVEQENLILENQLSKLKKKATLEEERSNLITQRQTLEEEINEQKERNQTLQERIEELKKSIEQLEEKQRLEEKILNYEADRAKLKEGEPCPLCGSTQHPLFSETIEPNKTKTLLEEQRSTYEHLLQEFHEIEKSMVSTEAKIKQLEEEINQKSQELIPLQHLKGEISTLQAQQEQLQKELQSVQHQRQELNFVKERINQAKEELLELKIRIQKNNSRKKVEEELQLKIQELSYYLIKTLRLYNITLDAHSLTLLSKQRDAHQKLSAELKELQHALHPIEGERIESLSKKNYIEEHLVSLKKRSSMQSCDILLLQQNRFAVLGDKDTAQYTQELANKLQVRQKSYDEFTKLKEQFNQQKSTYFSTVERLDKQQKLKLVNLESLEKQYQEQKEKLDAINQELGSINHQLTQDDEYLEREEQGVNRLEEQRQTVADLEELNALIGSEDGQKYQRYVQAKNLKALVTLANEHLKKFNHRYLLEIKDPQSLELEINDLYFENAKRAITTLSGGENFIVSLALSLALIDFNAKDIELNTLFLDEGFDSLDEESLTQVLQVLSTLEHQGKIIGIVSHTPLLQEHIKTQIRIEQKENGESHLTIYPTQNSEEEENRTLQEQKTVHEESP